MSANEWFGAVAPVGKLEPVFPSAEIVQSANLHQVPGARLTRDLRAVTDSRGFVTEFFLVDGCSLYGRVSGPNGTVGWIRSTRRVIDA